VCFTAVEPLSLTGDVYFNNIMPLNTGALASAINYPGTMNACLGLAALQKPKPVSAFAFM